MGKAISIQLTILFLICIVSFSTVSCGQGVLHTPDNFKSKVSVSRVIYQNDSTYLHFVLETMFLKHIEPFKPAAYYGDSTIFYVDSILYSPDLLRLEIQVIVRHLHKKENERDTSHYDFSANCLFGRREMLTDDIKVYQYSTYNTSNYENYGEIKQALIEYSFFRRATSKGWDENNATYNFDDIRFWNSAEFNDITSTHQFVQMQTH